LSNRKIKNKYNKNLDIKKLITFFLTIIICAGLIFNGYFFESQILTLNIITTAFFILCLVIFYRKNILLYYNKKTVLCGLVFLLINIIGLFSASHLRDALGNVLIIANAILLYFLACQSLKDRENLNVFLKGVYWTTVFIATIGISSYIFGVNMLNSYPQGDRIFSTLGYPNTVALIFVFAIFIGLYLMHSNLKNKKLFLLSNSILFLAFIGTKSRGVFLLVPLLVIIYTLLHTKENRLKVIGDLSLLIIPCVIIAPLVYNGTFANRELNNILISLISLLILFAFYYFSPKLLATRKNTKTILALAILIVFCGVGYLVANPEFLADNSVFARLTKINLAERSVQERFIFMQDALKIVKDNLFLGTGGGGWNAEYRAYRTFLYFTSEVHNHYLQVLVENGILGLAAYLGLWLFLIFNLWRKYINEKNDTGILLLIITFGLMLHSFIDFDLTYPVVYYLFWILMATALDSTKSFPGFKKRGSMIVGIAPLVILLIVNTSLLMGWSYGKDGTSAMAQNNISGAIEQLENSIIFDPVNSTYLTNLSQLYFAKGNSIDNQEYKDKAIAAIDKAIKYNPTNFEWYIIKTKFLVEMGQYEEAYQTALKAINYAPLEEVVYYDTTQFFIDSEKPEAAKYAEEIINLAKKEGEKIKENTFEKFWHGNKLYSSNKLAFLEGKINYKNENYKVAKVKFTQALVDKTLANDAQKLLQECFTLTGNYISNGNFELADLSGWAFNGGKGAKRELAKKDNKLWLHITKENKETTWWGFSQLVYDFDPGQKYSLSFDAFAGNGEGRLVLIVHQVGTDGINPQKSTTLSINNETKNYNWIFQTDNLENKDSLRIHLLVPNEPKEQDVYITNIKLNKVE